MSSKNIVMIGDHMQLPQPTTGNLDGESTHSPIEYLLKEKNTISDHNGIFLDRTFRMHQNICDFISKSFYENRLISDQTTHNQQVILQDGKSIENGIYLRHLLRKFNIQRSGVEVDRKIARILDITDLCQFRKPYFTIFTNYVFFI